MSPEMIGFSFIVLGFFLIIGRILRLKIKRLRDLFLPSSIIAGFIALLVGPEGLGRMLRLTLGEETFLREGVLTSEIVEVWSTLPGLFINVIFASLFLGKVVPGLKKIWLIAGPQVMMGQTVSFGQYVLGLLLSIFILTPLFGLSPLAGGLIEISFVGGHGTAAGLSDTFDVLGFSEGRDLALGLATIGIVSGVLIGIALINWGQRKGHLKFIDEAIALTDDEKEALSNFDTREQKKVRHSDSLEPLAYHFAIVGVSILIGYFFQQLLIRLEANTWGVWYDIHLFEFVPLFPLAMMGGMVVQVALTKMDRDEYIDRRLINRISGFSLDVLIVAALATIELTVIGAYFLPFLALALTAIIWNVFAFLVIAPRMIPHFWFERGIGDLGQAMGMTATGLLLIKIADPKQQSPAIEGFGYKQLLFEPLVGGGLFTAASLPLINQFGAVPMLVVSILLFAVFLLTGLFYFGKK